MSSLKLLSIKSKVMLLVAVALLAGVIVGWRGWFGYRRVPRGEALLQPWDGQVELSLITFNNEANFEVHGYSPGMTDSGPMGSVEYRYSYGPAAGRDIFEVRTTRPAWVFWWDCRGEPQNVLPFDPPLMRGADFLRDYHPWAIASTEGLRATVRSDGYPLRIMVIEPDQAGKDAPRIQRFIADALNRQLSDGQVAQILEMVEQLHSLDAQSAAKLMDISLGKTPVQIVDVQVVDHVQRIGPIETGSNVDHETADLRRHITEVLARLQHPPMTAAKPIELGK